MARPREVRYAPIASEMHQKTKLSSSLAQCLIILTISDLNPNALVSSGARQTSAHPLRGASFTRTQVANISPFARLAPRSLRNNLPPPPTGSQAPHNVSLPVPNTTYLQANRLHYQPTLSAQVASRESIFEWHSQRQPSNQVAANQWLQPKRATDFQLARPATEPANGQQHHLSRASVAEGVSLAAPPSEQHGGKLEKLFRGKFVAEKVHASARCTPPLESIISSACAPQGDRVENLSSFWPD